MSRSYERLIIEDFGRLTLGASDLDPVYDALVRMSMGQEQLSRWLLAYWLCYHPGAACYISEAEGSDFWHLLEVAALNEQPCPTGERWPRAPERRHWRGVAATQSVAHLTQRYDCALDMVEYCAHGDDGPRGSEAYRDVATRVRSHYAFGDWIAYKVADMLERVWGTEVVFGVGDAMYSEPTRAALMLFKDRLGVSPEAKVKNEAAAVQSVCDHLTSELSDFLAPGIRKPGRPVGLQEVETVLCKWKSHLSGHYPLHHDLREIRRGVEPWVERCATAAYFLKSFPPLPSLTVSAER